jgi:hypothetical protein
MSGIANTPFACNIQSVAVVVGPFAASATTFALIRSAFSILIWLSGAR